MKIFLRVWKEQDLDDIEKHLIVAGELSSECFVCHEVGVDSTVRKCPSCGAVFKYMGFRRKDCVNFLRRIQEDNLDMVFIDFDDFKKSLNRRDAKNLLDL